MSLVVMISGGCGPVWYLDPGFGQRLAKQQDKPLLMYFKAWDSTQHRNMKLKVFEHPSIKKELMDTINVELEFAWFPDYAQRYRVQRAQVCVMCSPEGDRVSSPMYVNPVPGDQEFLDWLQKAKAAAKPEPKPSSAPAEAGPATKEEAAQAPSTGPPDGTPSRKQQSAARLPNSGKSAEPTLSPI